MALMISGLWCCGLLCLGSRSVGIMVGCSGFILSSCSPSCVASRACRVGSACGVIISICVWVLKSLIVLFPRFSLTIGHLPPLCFSNWSWRSLNVHLCMDVHNLALYSHPPKRYVLLSGWLHLVHIIGPCELCLFLHWYTCDLQATSYASRLDLYGDCENACMLKFVPVPLASLRSLPKTLVIVTILLVCFSFFIMPALRLVSFRMFFGLFGGVCLVCGHVRRPSIGGSSS